MAMKRTKKLNELFTKYDVTVHKSDSVVTNQRTGKKTTVPPIEFAIYETAIKAIESHYQAAGNPTSEWMRRIAADGGFALPTKVESGEKPAVTHAEDYAYCCRLIMKAGLYFDLLD